MLSFYRIMCIHELMNNQKTILAIVVIVAAIGLAVSTVASSAAYAAITPHCRNPSGNENSGCNDNNQPPQKEQNENPAGKAPPGQNK
jgi:hypothetical protein